MKMWLIATVLLVLTGCDYNHSKGREATIAPSGNVPNEKLSSPDYETVNTLVLKDRCVRCHSEKGGLRGGLDLEGYEKVKANLRDIYTAVFVDKEMPPRGPLSADEAKILRLWIEQGAPLKNGCNLATDPNFECTPLTWANITTRVLTPKCADCHSGSKIEGGFDVSVLADVRAKSALIIDRVFVKKDMPQDPVTPMTIEERRALFNWIDLGMPE